MPLLRDMDERLRERHFFVKVHSERRVGVKPATLATVATSSSASSGFALAFIDTKVGITVRFGELRKAQFTRGMMEFVNDTRYQLPVLDIASVEKAIHAFEKALPV